MAEDRGSFSFGLELDLLFGPLFACTCHAGKFFNAFTCELHTFLRLLSASISMHTLCKCSVCMQHVCCISIGMECACKHVQNLAFRLHAKCMLTASCCLHMQSPNTPTITATGEMVHACRGMSCCDIMPIRVLAHHDLKCTQNLRCGPHA